MTNRLRNLAINVFNAGLDLRAMDRHAFVKAQTIGVAIAVAIIASFGFSLFYTAFPRFWPGCISPPVSYSSARIVISAITQIRW